MEFTTKDSGEREQFGSGMVRDTQANKLRYDLALDGPLMWEVLRQSYSEKENLILTAQRWYEYGGLNFAVAVVQMIGTKERDILDRYAQLMMRGAVKYAEKNWMKASGEAELARFKSSFCRHFKQYIFGDTDEDHAAAIVFNLNGAEYVKGKLNEANIPF